MIKDIYDTWLSNKLFHAVYGQMDYLKDYNEDTITNKKEIALIAIKDPGQLPHPETKVQGFADVLQIQFWDIEESFSRYEAITKEQGSTIEDFIIKNKDKRFLIHCAAGQSRSSGVACAVECIINYSGDNYAYKTGYSSIKAFDSDRYSPNWTVYDSIIT